jgi:hypothetical protein
MGILTLVRQDGDRWRADVFLCWGGRRQLELVVRGSLEFVESTMKHLPTLERDGRLAFVALLDHERCSMRLDPALASDKPARADVESSS